MHAAYKAYLHGAIHDGTINRHHQTARFCQKEREWLELLQQILQSLGCSAWLYREGKTRNLFVLETKAQFLQTYVSPKCFQTKAERIAYIRGYFDAEGGVPSRLDSRFYIQFCQKNLPELSELQEILKASGIQSGRIHVPSVRVDPNYYRFFVGSNSYQRFIAKVNSWHPRKKPILNSRMKI